MNTHHSDIPFNSLPPLPPRMEIETTAVLKQAILANKYLAELKGYCQTLPDPNVLLNTITLHESKDSSAVENIVTTQDDLYRALLKPGDQASSDVREVLRYRTAIYEGIKEFERTGSITINLAVKIMQVIKHNNGGIRTIPGTKLANPVTKKIIYTPPEPRFLVEMLTDWEDFVNTSDSALDPLVRMALMHYQFEAIHPFSDGNGRTGRILNVLFLIKENLLSIPVLYHSAYIIQHKSEYYKRLREVTQHGNWEAWILYMLQAVEETSRQTTEVITRMLQLKDLINSQIRSNYPAFPAADLVDLIFRYPYIKVRNLEEAGLAKRQTAARYLQSMERLGILYAVKSGRENIYINDGLMKVFAPK